MYVYIFVCVYVISRHLREESVGEGYHQTGSWTNRVQGCGLYSSGSG